MATDTAVLIPAGEVDLPGDLSMPDPARGVVLFAHGSGSSRHSPRNRMVAGVLTGHGFATVLFDLLTAEEERVDARTGHLRFDIGLLAGRMVGALDWLAGQPATVDLPVGLFGASTGAAAALVAAAHRPGVVRAVVSRGGRPDLAGDDLTAVGVPTLLLVGGLDEEVLALNDRASRRLAGPVRLRVVPDASHLFTEPGALEQVAEAATDWFGEHLTTGPGPATAGGHRDDSGSP